MNVIEDGYFRFNPESAEKEMVKKAALLEEFSTRLKGLLRYRSPGIKLVYDQGIEQKKQFPFNFSVEMPVENPMAYDIAALRVASQILVIPERWFINPSQIHDLSVVLDYHTFVVNGFWGKSL